MTWTRIRLVALAAGLALAAASCGDGDPVDENTTQASPGDNGSPSGEPILVGSSLSLTGLFAPTGAIHKVAGEQFVERLNKGGGLLGRPVEWALLDDESDSAKVSALYERLITEDEVDLIIGPYATPNVVASMAVAERQGFALPQHTAVLTYALTYECQFPAWSVGENPPVDIPNLVFDLLETQPNPPQRIAFVTNQAGSTDYISHGEPEADDPDAVQVAEERGYEVVLDLPYPPDIADWGPVASRVRDADPDFLWVSGIALDSANLLQAMQQLQYEPPPMFDLFPAPGPLLGAGEAAEGMLAVSLFEPNKTIVDRLSPDAAEIIESFATAAEAADIPYPVFETQAAASWTAWEILVSGVEGAGSTDNEAVCDHLRENGADTTFFGHIDFNAEANNFYPNLGGLKQIQQGEWVFVWPSDRAGGEYVPPAS